MRDFDSFGTSLRLIEWGDPAAAPVVLCRGMFDHGRGFATLAPLLAERFRVIALDARGHGDSAWCDAYPWLMDVIDVVRSLAPFASSVTDGLERPPWWESIRGGERVAVTRDALAVTVAALATAG